MWQKCIFFSEVEKFERKTFLKRDYISCLDCDGEIDTGKYTPSNYFSYVKCSFEIKIVCRASRPWAFRLIVFARTFLGLVACSSMQRVQVRSLFGELRSHMPHGQKTKT